LFCIAALQSMYIHIYIYNHIYIYIYIHTHTYIMSGSQYAGTEANIHVIYAHTYAFVHNSIRDVHDN